MERRYVSALAEELAQLTWTSDGWADRTRLGDSVGHLTFDELRRVDAALRLVLDL